MDEEALGLVVQGELKWCRPRRKKKGDREVAPHTRHEP